MSLTLEKLADEFRPFHNHICVVHDCQLVRLVGVAEDDMDFYYKVVEMGGRVSYCSAVGSCVSIKPGYPPDRYESVDRVFALNNAAPTLEFGVVSLPPSNLD